MEKDEKKCRKSLEGKKKVVPLQSRLKRGSLRQESRGIEKPKKLQKSFAESKKVSTFATPIEKGVWKSGPEGSKYRKRSLKRLKESTRKQVPKQNERERQFLRETNRQVKLREIEIYKEEFDPGSG